MLYESTTFEVGVSLVLTGNLVYNKGSLTRNVPVSYQVTDEIYSYAYRPTVRVQYADMQYSRKSADTDMAEFEGSAGNLISEFSIRKHKVYGSNSFAIYRTPFQP